jgi:hypothetical protein
VKIGSAAAATAALARAAGVNFMAVVEWSELLCTIAMLSVVAVQAACRVGCLLLSSVNYIMIVKFETTIDSRENYVCKKK